MAPPPLALGEPGPCWFIALGALPIASVSVLVLALVSSGLVVLSSLRSVSEEVLRFEDALRWKRLLRVYTVCAAFAALAGGLVVVLSAVRVVPRRRMVRE